ncbi:MAG: DUF1573 domain-containing protein [Pirellula sp.]
MLTCLGGCILWWAIQYQTRVSFLLLSGLSHSIALSSAVGISVAILATMPAIACTDEIIVELKDTFDSQNFSIPALLPGAKSKFEIKLINRTGRDLVMEEIRSSCGCMVAGNVKKDFAANETVVFPVDLRTPTTAGKFGTSLTIVDKDKNEWLLSFDSQVIAPIICEQTDFNLSGTSAETFRFSLAFDDRFQQLAKELNDLIVSPNGEGIQELQLLNASEARGMLSMKAQLPKERLVGNHFSSMIRFSSKSFKLDVPVVFRFSDEPRVLLKSVSRSRMKDGVQRIIVVGGIAADRAELRAIADGVEIDTELVKNGEKISIFNVRVQGDVSKTESIEVGVVKGMKYIPLTSVTVRD